MIPAFLTSFSEYIHPLQKPRFHRDGKTFMRQSAKALGLTKGEFNIRSCEGGTAVLGEVILHTDNYYMQLHQTYAGNGLTIMFRTCKGREDYCGGPNNFIKLDNFEMTHFINTLKKIA